MRRIHRLNSQRVTLVFAMIALTVRIANADGEPPLPPGLGGAEPKLPAGLKKSAEPKLPVGLEENDEPKLPAGLGAESNKPVQSNKTSSAGSILENIPFDLTGFWEVRGGMRTQRDRTERDASIGESRIQLEAEQDFGNTSVRVTSDFLYDPVFDHHSVYLERGLGWLDLREAYVAMPITSFADAKLGRQILTWGTGDMLFINDLFPKDWNSFYIGRDEEYLKAPSDAAKLSFYSDMANLDLVYVPRFDSDRYIDGRRISFWNNAFGRRTGQDAVVHVDKPDDWFQDDEIAVRLFKNVAAYELALYGYHGFWKSPAGMNPVSGKATFPELSAYGASVRGSVGPGIGSIEAGYYDSEDDRDGDNPFVNNGETRFLAGYEQEIGKDFTAAIQYYLEHMTDYGAYRRA
ncbi:MAG: hypothetical protein J7M12_05035, partial [Candidatus Hydrogenedentes bacterium]|nr:hypothetical protein [Candidatus Hydrogenedentota bacterium]